MDRSGLRHVTTAASAVGDVDVYDCDPNPGLLWIRNPESLLLVLSSSHPTITPPRIQMSWAWSVNMASRGQAPCLCKLCCSGVLEFRICLTESLLRDSLRSHGLASTDRPSSGLSTGVWLTTAAGYTSLNHLQKGSFKYSSWLTADETRCHLFAFGSQVLRWWNRVKRNMKRKNSKHCADIRIILHIIGTIGETVGAFLRSHMYNVTLVISER